MNNEKRILLFSGSAVFLVDLKNYKDLNGNKFKEICRKFECDNLGQLKFGGGEGSRRNWLCFIKNDYDDIKEEHQIGFSNSLLKYNVSIEA